MRIDEWAGLLNADFSNSKNRDDDFWALCPCHTDHDPSLHVYIGKDGGIVMRCHVCGAGNKAVCEAMGQPMREVMVDARTGEDLNRNGRAASSAPKPRKPKAPKLAEDWKEGDIWKLGKAGEKQPYTLTRLYDYEDREGRVVLQKARLEYQAETGKKKEFFFRHRETDGRWYTGTGIYSGILYHLPDVDRARKTGEPLYIVEGEKDADNLRAVGMLAVSSAYGGGLGKLEGKWKPEYTDAIKGAGHVIVVPDNDGPGEELAQWICGKLHGQVGTLRILHLCESLTDAEKAEFAKGDFTDWWGLRRKAGKGKTEILEEFAALSEAAPLWTPQTKSLAQFTRLPESGEPAEGTDAEENGDPYYDLKAYSIKWGRLCKVDSRSGAQVLCDFVPIPKETITYDDGTAKLTKYLIGGVYGSDLKKELPDALITSDELESMRWPSAVWPFVGNIRPKKGARDFVRDAIMQAGQRAAQMRTVYSHTGIRMVDGKPCYLYNGGAIGNDHVSVELTNNLKYYTLDVPEKATRQRGLDAFMRLLMAFPLHILLPILAQAFLAPLYSVMEDMEDPPSYVVYVVGRTGSFKSTLVGYVESMFGRFYLRRHTATFQETANQVRDKTFYAKDALFVVDDYNPETDARRRSAMDAVAQAVVTAIADRAERGGLTADRKMRAARPARCTCVMTGEQLPGLNQGRVLRLYVIEVGHNEIAEDVGDLMPFQEDAEAGLYRTVMRGYVEALLARWDGMDEEIRERRAEARRLIDRDKQIPRQYARMISTGVHLLMGCGLMVDQLIHEGAIGPEDRDAWMETSRAAIIKNILAQGAAIDEASPASMYLSAIQSLVRTRQLRLYDMEGSSQAYAGPGGVTGRFDNTYYYFDPGALDGAVREALKKRGTELGVSASVIRKMLMEKGYCEGDASGNACKVKTIDGHRQRLLWMKRSLVDGLEVDETITTADCTPADDEQLPF